MDDKQKDYFHSGYLTQLDPDFGYGYEEPITWENLSLQAKVYPELANQTLYLIEKRLGYIPRLSMTILYEPSLRLHYHDYLFGKIAIEEWHKRTDKLLKLMREWDFKYESKLFDQPHTYQQYSEYYMPYIQTARARIVQCLGYQPDAAHSLAAELWLAYAIAEKELHLPANCLTPYDCRAITSIRYRETLLEAGETAANEAPLLGLSLLLESSFFAEK